MFDAESHNIKKFVYLIRIALKKHLVKIFIQANVINQIISLLGGTLPVAIIAQFLIICNKYHII